MSAPVPTNRGTFAIAMSRTVLVHTVLASAALVVAYMTWSAGDRAERPQEEVTVLECAAADLRSVSFTSKRRSVKIEWRRERGERVAWISVTGERLSHGRPPETKRFAGNEDLDRWVEENTPMRALRSLGDVDRARLAELELVDTDSRLAVDCGGRRATYRLGGSAYGTGERYARASTGGPVYLFGASLVSDIESAESRFMQRDLHRFRAADIDKIRVETAGRTRTLLQRNRRTPEQAAWVDEASPGQRNELYGNWLDRVGAMRVTEYLPPGREPGSEISGTAGVVTQVATLRYEADGREKGTLTLVRIDTAGSPTYYARSEVTHGWVKVLGSVATQVEQDARPVVGLDPIAPPPAPTRPQPPTPAPGADARDAGIAPAPGGPPRDAGARARPPTPRLPVPSPIPPDLH